MIATATEVKPKHTSGRSRWCAADNVRRASKLDRKPRQTNCSNVFRWYRAGWGRYTQRDPLDFFAPATRSTRNSRFFHPYAYADQDPVALMDSRGLDVGKGATGTYLKCLKNCQEIYATEIGKCIWERRLDEMSCANGLMACVSRWSMGLPPILQPNCRKGYEICRTNTRSAWDVCMRQTTVVYTSCIQDTRCCQ